MYLPAAPSPLAAREDVFETVAVDDGFDEVGFAVIDVGAVLGAALPD